MHKLEINPFEIGIFVFITLVFLLVIGGLIWGVATGTIDLTGPTPIPGYVKECHTIVTYEYGYNIITRKYENHVVNRRVCRWVPPTATACPSTFDYCGR